MVPRERSSVVRVALACWILVALFTIGFLVTPGQAQTPANPQAVASIPSFNAWVASMRDALSGNRDQDLARLNQAKGEAVNAAWLTLYPQAQTALLGHLDRIIQCVSQTQAGQPYPAAVNESASQIVNVCQWIRQQLTAASGSTATNTPVPNPANPVTTPGPQAGTQPPTTGQPQPGAVGEGPISLGGVSLETPGGTTSNGPPINTPPVAPGMAPVAAPPGTVGAPASTSGVPQQPGVVSGVPQQPGTAGVPAGNPAGPWTQTGGILPTGYPQQTNVQMQQLMAVLSQLMSRMGGSLEVVSAGVSSYDPNMASVTIRIRPGGFTTAQPQWTGTPQVWPQPPVYQPTASQPTVTQPTVNQPTAPDPRIAAERAELMKQAGSVQRVLESMGDAQLSGFGQFLTVSTDSSSGPAGTQTVRQVVRTNQSAIVQIETACSWMGSDPMRSRFPAERAQIETLLNQLRTTVWASTESGRDPQQALSEAAGKVRQIRQQLQVLFGSLTARIQAE